MIATFAALWFTLLGPGSTKKAFESIREQNTDDPAAWNGLGSVALLKNEPDKALIYIDRALERVPTNAAAKRDRKTALRMLKRKE